jgi:hypothetical protein
LKTISTRRERDQACIVWHTRNDTGHSGMSKLILRLRDKDTVITYGICLIALVFQLLLVGNIASNFNFYILRTMPDDAFYYFKIAENISLGHGSVFSIGEPTNGYHPLWMAVLVLVHVLFSPDKNTFVLSALVVSVVINVISAVILYRLLCAFGFSQTQSRVGIICFLFSPWIVRLTLTGLETPIFYTFLFSFLLVVQTIFADDNMQSRRNAVLLGITAGILMLARTDAIFFTIPLFLLILLKKRLGAIRTLLIAGSIATGIVLPWLVWNLQRFHTIEQTSSIAMSALNQYALPPIVSVDYWLLSGTFMLWVAYSTVVALFYLYPPDYQILQYSYIAMIAFSFFLGITLYKRSKTTHIIIPKTLVIPAIILVAYYFFIRFFVQIWHVSALHILFIVFFINYIPAKRSIPTRYLMVLIILLAIPTFYSSNIGYFHSQDNMIEQAETYRSDSEKNLVICASDAGYLGYYSRHTVINVDGIVNNRAKD